jgi:membrane protease YdiL (CAAX protease family)
VNDRYAQTVGFVVAGVGLAAAFLDWGSVEPLLPQVAGVFAGIALFTFAARRYGAGDPAMDYAAGVGGVGLTLVAAAAIVSLTGPLAAGPLVALFAGFGVVGTGLASAAGVDRAGVRSREARLIGAVVASATALILGGLLGAVAVSFAPDAPIWRIAVNTAVASGGFAFAGLVILRAYEGSIDVSTPGRRDLLAAVVGVVAIFALHFGMSYLVAAFSLPQTSHGLVRTARDNPGILLPLVVLSYVAIAPAEELLARNGIQKYLYGAFSRHSAVVVASLVFASSHLLSYAGGGVSPGAVLVTLTRVFVVSLVLGVTYERTEDLFAPVAVHGTYNAVQFLMAYLAFS